MSLLLRKSIPAAAKAGSRRRLVVASTTKQSFWQREARWSLGTRSFATFSPDEREQDTRQQLAPISSSILDWNVTRPIERLTTTNNDSLVIRSANGIFRPLEGGNSALTNSMVRYVPPPSSIRSRHTLINLVAAERAACDLALRSLTTWVSNNNRYPGSPILQALSKSPQQPHQCFSTKIPGSKVSKSGIPKAKIPTPSSGPEQQSMNPEHVMEQLNQQSKTVVLPALQSGLKSVLKFILNLPKNMIYYLFHPSEVKEWWQGMKKTIKDEIDHYWVGTKLLWADLKTARNLLRRTLRGSSLTRRERKQLLRTISDLFRLVPFSMFLIIPLMEFALPFALKIFPNLLPSTFQDSLKAEENMKRELQSRIAMAKFFQETLEELAKEQKKSASQKKEEIKVSGEEDGIDVAVVLEQEESAASFLDFLEKARSGEPLPNSVILDYAHYFHDDLTLDNMPRMQLINMCKYMGIAPYGSDSFLRFQLRHRMRMVKEDDQRILWEGIDSLTKMELREACQERGMRSTGLSKDAYKRALQQWIDLSVKQNVPTSLLIMSRTFFLREETFEHETDEASSKSLAGLADAISGLDKEVVNEVILDVATSEEKVSDPGVRKIKLEVLMKQNQIIEEEQAEREEAAAKKKEQADKERKEAEIKSSMEEPSYGVSEGEKQSDEPIIAGSEGDGMASEQVDVAPGSDQEVKAKKVDEDLSAAEMEALSQLVSADPVSKERADLQSIKAALQDQKSSESSETDISDPGEKSAMEGSSGLESIDTEMPGRSAPIHLNDATDNTELPKEVFSTEVSEKSNVESEPDVPEDPVVARLKKKIGSMVDKIEMDISDVEVKIGDKFHVLDKDMDGILSVEEVAEALQQVLKRKITSEEAMVIAQEMDANKDGDLTVQELIQWVEMNQLVRFVEEGRDHDMDRIIEKQQSAAENQESQEEQSGVQQGSDSPNR